VDDFRETIEPFRGELRVHCYRMLGSLTDAEDVLQETMLAAWRGMDGFEGRSSLRAWLYRIATNRCLNARRSARRVPEPVPPFDPPAPSSLAEVTWLEPFPDAMLPEADYGRREQVELAFVTSLQRLPPRQTAVLILRDVLGYDGAEVAAMLDTTATAVKGMLQRARATLAAGNAAPAAPVSADDRKLTRRFAEAFTVRDIDALLSLLTDDAFLTMPPAPHEYHGRPAIRAFLQVSGAWRGNRTMTLSPVAANNQIAYACRLTEPGTETPRPAGLMVLTLREGRIAGLTRFLNNEPLIRFGLL
jgi:RNA polymerase sigma-70 factor (TIGR02960 family)